MNRGNGLPLLETRLQKPWRTKNKSVVCSIFNKRDAFDFHIVNFPDLPGNIPTAPVMVHISHNGLP